jgi:hypothetical protein
MGFGSWWHWILLILIFAVTYFQVLFILRSRKLIMAKPLGNQFFHPNLAWVCLVPWVNIIWVPLTVFAVEKTIAKGVRKSAYFKDRVLVTCGRFLKYWLIVGIGIEFIRYLMVYYLPQLLPVGQSIERTSVLAIVLNVFDGAFYLVLFGFFVSVIWYPIRLGRLLTNNPVGSDAKFGQS